MRGRTLEDAYVILDEAQNTTDNQMKMFLTRLGFNSKMIITGDITQIDLPRGMESGLVKALKILNGVKAVSYTHLDVYKRQATIWCVNHFTTSATSILLRAH